MQEAGLCKEVLSEEALNKYLRLELSRWVISCTSCFFLSLNLTLLGYTNKDISLIFTYKVC